MNGQEQGGYPPQGGGYPPQGGGYPPQGGGYPPQGGGYPPQGGGYPPQGGGYPGGYPGGPAQRSGAPKVMGILMIIFASLGLLGSLYGLIASPSAELPGDLLKSLKSYGLLVDGTGFVLSVLHLVAGIFAVGYKPKAPMLASAYAISAIVWAVFRIGLYFGWIAPKMKEVAGTIGEAAGNVVGGAMIVGAFIVAIWPVLVLILMNTKGAKAACTGNP